MGIDSRRPPLPAPTESMDEHSGADTEVATNLTARTDTTHISIPEDGRPITLSTDRITVDKSGVFGGTHRRKKSQTSLLIEYFEAGHGDDKGKSKPSVRVRVTPSASKRSKASGAHDTVKITGIGRDRKTSYSRKISLGRSQTDPARSPIIFDSEKNHSSEGSDLPPIDIEVLHDGSDISFPASTRGLRYAHEESNVSSMPPDSMLDGMEVSKSPAAREDDYDEIAMIKNKNRLAAPTTLRNRTTSRDRITQRVMEKLGQHRTQKSGLMGVQDEGDAADRFKMGRSTPVKGRTRFADDDLGSESGLGPSQLSPSQVSYRSSTTQGSRMTNNPKLLEMVEDTIKRVILPEIDAIKETQKTRRVSGSRRRSSKDYDEEYENTAVDRRAHSSSSTPIATNKLRAARSKESGSPGTLRLHKDSASYLRRLSHEDVEEHKPSSSRSSRRQSRDSGNSLEPSHIARRTDRSSRPHKARDAAGVALVGAALTAAALEHYDSGDERKEAHRTNEKQRSSRRRSRSTSEVVEREHARQQIPALPLSGRVLDSELTRESLLSTNSEYEDHTMLKDARKLPANVFTEQSHAPTDSPRTPVRSTNSPRTTKDRVAALAAASQSKKSYIRHVDADGYGSPGSPHRPSSMSSVSSLKRQFEERNALAPQTQVGRDRSASPAVAITRKAPDMHVSQRSSPATAMFARSLQSPVSNGSASRSLSRGALGGEVNSGPGTPNAESVDEWYEQQHRVNDQYRNSYEEPATNRSSYQTNPFPDDEIRHRSYSNRESHPPDGLMTRERDVKPLAAVPKFVHEDVGVESNVASLMEPSMLSSSVRSSHDESRTNGTYAERMNEHLRNASKPPAAFYEGSTLSQSMPSQDRWAALRGHAMTLSKKDSQSPSRASPQQSNPPRDHEQALYRDGLGSSAVPVANDPMPEIGHFDDGASDVTTNPSIIQGPLSGDVTGNNTWPYTPDLRDSMQKTTMRNLTPSQDERHAESEGLNAAAGVAIVGSAALAARLSSPDKHDVSASSQHFQRNIQQPSPPQSRGQTDDGQEQEHEPRTGSITPRSHDRVAAKVNNDSFSPIHQDRASGTVDPFTTGSEDQRRISGRSHGMSSPIYDSATGNGLDRIQSRDIVALMDHLTVRDAQRNARDTEILVTLVRSAAEMRQSFDEMRRFIAEQDRLIMENTSRDAEHTVQKLTIGHKNQVPSKTRTTRPLATEEVQAKRKNVLRRALHGLTGGKRIDDLARVEEMLMQILDNVEDLKQTHPSAPPSRDTFAKSVSSYEKMRGSGESISPANEAPRAQPDTDHTDLVAGAQRIEKHQFHSGYDGRRGSATRVSTVDEDDEDDALEPHEAHILDNQFENNERMLTPTQELVRARGHTSLATPTKIRPVQTASPRDESRTRSYDGQQKHISNGSNFGPPKISRWSKTTTSSIAPDPMSLNSPNPVRTAQAPSEASRSRSQVGKFDTYQSAIPGAGDPMRDGGRVSNGNMSPAVYSETRSLRSQDSRITRTPSPLIPSEVSHDHYQDEDYSQHSPLQDDEHVEFDDPKYQAHRNSLLLQHPQPRQGSMSRHQNTLETQARDFENPSTGSDISQRSVSDFDPATWGSSGAAALSRSRFAEGKSSNPSLRHGDSRHDDDPLIPNDKPPSKQMSEAWHTGAGSETSSEDDMEWEPQYSNSGFSRGGYYSSPYGSGHLLEPIEEVRNSLETDRTMSPKPRNSLIQAQNTQSPNSAKIGGPRPMSDRKSVAIRDFGTSGTVRRKPVAQGQASREDLYDDTF